MNLRIFFHRFFARVRQTARFTKRKAALFYSLFCIDFRLYDAYIGKVAVFLVIIKTVAHNKFIRHHKAGIVRLYVDLAAFRLIKQGCDFY